MPNLHFLFKIYKLYFNKDEKPKVPEKIYTYTTEMIKDGQMWTSGDGYKLLVKSSEYSETGKIWIGLKPILGKKYFSKSLT